MNRIRRSAIVATLIGAAAGSLFTSAAPAQAACAMTTGTYPVAHVYACTSGYCRVYVLGDRVFSCP